MSINILLAVIRLNFCDDLQLLVGAIIRAANSFLPSAKLQEQKHTGMFAMTERGHGSNVRGIQTEATFDISTQVRLLSTALCVRVVTYAEPLFPPSPSTSFM